MSKEFSRRQFLKGTALATIAVGTSILTANAEGSSVYSPAQSPLLESPLAEPEFVPFQVGGINYGTEGVEKGPLTKLSINLPGQIRKVNKFVMDTYPRILTSEDTNPAGDYTKKDNPTYWNGNGVVVQTIHSGNVWGSDLPANPLRVELQEKNRILAWENITSEEGLKRRNRFKNAPFTLEQGNQKEQGNLLGIYHIAPQDTLSLHQAYVEAQGGPVDMTIFSDYDGPELNPSTDVIYFYCTEPYSDEVQRDDVDYYSQGRDLLIVRIDD